MGIMNGMFIMDEADKTEKFAIATLLEILDPEQNHLFHDKYTQTTVDIDLSKCHFILTANTLETVPPAVVNRCEVVILDRYSLEEKVAIAQQHLLERIRRRHEITEDQIALEPGQEQDMLRYLIKTYTREAGVRELERIIRTLFLRVFRKDILTGHRVFVAISREVVKQYLEEPNPPRMINPDDRVGEMMGLGINPELGIGSIIPIQATQIRVGTDEQRKGYLSVLQATGNIEKIMDESRTVATTAMLHCGLALGIPLDQPRPPIHLHFMGGSTPKDGPSAGGAIALALSSVLTGRRIRRDVAMTGEIDTQGRITGIGGLDVKLETAGDAGCKTVIIPRENLFGEAGIERLSSALKRELHTLTYEQWNGEHEPFDYERHMLQVIAVDDIVQAADIAFVDEVEIKSLENPFLEHAFMVAPTLHATCEAPSACFRVLYIKKPDELEMENLADLSWKTCGSVLLIKPELRDMVLRLFPDIEEHTRLWDFDPPRQNLEEVLTNLDADLGGNLRTSVHLSLLAPHFFMVSQKPFLESFYGSPTPERLTLFANNYTLQGVKIKESKAVLNNVYRYLSQLDREQLDKCPFLSNREGIYVVDISYMPEKYRLDAKRAQEILNSGLRNWLSIMDKAVQPPDLETEQTGGNSGARGVARNEPSGASELKKTRR
jgi:ATP-dependent Lon protease